MNIPKVKTRFEVLNSAKKEEVDIYMYGSISSYSWYEGISSKKVREQLAGVTAKVINVHINSPGGDVFESIAISNLLKKHSADIHVHIDGIAASGGSVIAMGADKVIMPSNTMMMIHKAWTYAAGNAEALRKTANKLDKIDSAVTASYTSRYIGDKEELEELLAEETWLTAEECKLLGFCDEIVDEIEIPEDEEDEEKEVSAKEKILNKHKSKVVASSESPQQGSSEKPTTNSNTKAVFALLNAMDTTNK